MSSGLSARQLILQQLSAVAQHSPFRSVVAAALSTQNPMDPTRVDAQTLAGGNGRSASNEDHIRSSSPIPSNPSWWRGILIQPERHRGTFTLMTEEEMAFLRRRRDEDGEASRIILATRPTRHLLHGLAGGVLNVSLGCLLSPLLALSVALEALRLGGLRPTTLFVAPLTGLVWGAVFVLLAFYAALQQLSLCALYQLLTPVVYLRGRGHVWSALACRYECPHGTSGHAHPMLLRWESDAKLRERGMRRESHRRQGTNRRTASYRRQSPTGSNSEDADYYAILGLDRAATPAQIKEAYNRLVLKLHPDKNPNREAAAQFDRVTKAYRVLSHAERRRKYDLGGTSGVEDLGEKKRSAVRALFGGDVLFVLVGDVKTGSFSQRVIDGLDFTQEELAVRRMRMLQRCRDELLETYLTPLQGGNSPDAFRHQLRRLLNTGLAKEVLYAVGNEYRRVIRYSEADSVLARLQLYFNETFSHRMRRRFDKWRCLCRIRQHTFKDSAAMVDLAWYTSVEELEVTARWVAAAAVMDLELSKGERMRRRDALSRLAETFIAHGQPYKGANKQTMDTLMDSLREYQQEQQRQKEKS